MKPAPAESTGDSLRLWIVRHTAFVLLAIPVVISELVGAAGDYAGRSLITDYLLRRNPDLHRLPEWFIPLLLSLQILYCVGNVVFLLPVFRVQQRMKIGGPLDDAALLAARTRIYNFPPWLIGSTWITWAAGHAILVLFGRGDMPAAPIIVYSLISVILNAVIVYYAADLLIRSVLNPVWFPDGKFHVSFRLRAPWLSLRFLDMFLVNAVFPVVSIVGIVAMTTFYGTHDSLELERLLRVCGVVGCVFWAFGFFLTILNSHALLLPIHKMEKAAAELGAGSFDVRVPVHSDDALGKLEQTINELGRTLREKEMIKTIFGHYVSPSVRDLILGGKVRTDGEEIEAVVLFSDIRSFTSLSERYPPEKIIRLLNLHFSRVVDVVSRNNGFVDKFIGDAVMAVFDADLTDSAHRLCALSTAVELIAGLAETNAEIALLGMEPIEIGIGLACGRVIRGNVGSADRRELTVIGSTVNLASRLEAATREIGFPICATIDSYDGSCGSIARLRIAEERAIILKGISEPVQILGITLSK